MNLYRFVHNSPLDRGDPDGLQIWLCTRRSVGWPFYGFGRHAYLWDDGPRIPWKRRSCGREGSSGYGPTQEASDVGPIAVLTPLDLHGGGPAVVDDLPGDVECRPVLKSGGNEERIMKYCRKNINKGTFKPLLNDCQTAANRVIREAGFESPGSRLFNDDDFDFEFPK